MKKHKFNIKPLVPEMGTPRQTSRPPSRVTPGGDCSVKEIPKYTGTEMLGISIIHKSCLQPVFSKQSAVDAATMRR